MSSILICADIVIMYYVYCKYYIHVMCYVFFLCVRGYSMGLNMIQHVKLKLHYIRLSIGYSILILFFTMYNPIINSHWFLTSITAPHPTCLLFVGWWIAIISYTLNMFEWLNVLFFIECLIVILVQSITKLNIWWEKGWIRFPSLHSSYYYSFDWKFYWEREGRGGAESGGEG